MLERVQTEISVKAKKRKTLLSSHDMIQHIDNLHLKLHVHNCADYREHIKLLIYILNYLQVILLGSPII